MRAREAYQIIDQNSDPGVPLTFYSAQHDPYCPPPFEDCPFFIAPGYTYSINLDPQRKFTRIVFHHDPNGVEVTKEIILDVLEPFTYRRKEVVNFTIFNMEDDDWCFFIDGDGIWCKMECPEPNVFYCYAVYWPAGETGGNNNCVAVSQAYM